MKKHRKYYTFHFIFSIPAVILLIANYIRSQMGIEIDFNRLFSDFIAISVNTSAILLIIFIRDNAIDIINKHSSNNN